MESYEQCGQGRSYCSFCALDTIHRPFFVTRLIINKINKVQWVDFKLENVLVSLHCIKTMDFAPSGTLLPYFLGMESYLDILLYVFSIRLPSFNCLHMNFCIPETCITSIVFNKCLSRSFFFKAVFGWRTLFMSSSTFSLE